MINENANVEEIWYQEPGDGVAECVSIRVAGGPVGADLTLSNVVALACNGGLS